MGKVAKTTIARTELTLDVGWEMSAHLEKEDCFGKALSRAGAYTIRQAMFSFEHRQQERKLWFLHEASQTLWHEARLLMTIASRYFNILDELRVTKKCTKFASVPYLQSSNTSIHQWTYHWQIRASQKFKNVTRGPCYQGSLKLRSADNVADSIDITPSVSTSSIQRVYDMDNCPKILGPNVPITIWKPLRWACIENLRARLNSVHLRARLNSGNMTRCSINIHSSLSLYQPPVPSKWISSSSATSLLLHIPTFGKHLLPSWTRAEFQNMVYWQFGCAIEIHTW